MIVRGESGRSSTIKRNKRNRRRFAATGFNVVHEPPPETKNAVVNKNPPTTIAKEKGQLGRTPISNFSDSMSSTRSHEEENKSGAESSSGLKKRKNVSKKNSNENETSSQPIELKSKPVIKVSAMPAVDRTNHVTIKKPEPKIVEPIEEAVKLPEEKIEPAKSIEEEEEFKPDKSIEEEEIEPDKLIEKEVKPDKSIEEEEIEPIEEPVKLVEEEFEPTEEPIKLIEEVNSTTETINIEEPEIQSNNHNLELSSHDLKGHLELSDQASIELKFNDEDHSNTHEEDRVDFSDSSAVPEWADASIAQGRKMFKTN
jgi:hypothetical protein